MKKERKRYLCPKIGVFENKLKAKTLFFSNFFWWNQNFMYLCIDY